MKPKVFLDIVIGTKSIGRIEIELFYDITPITAENFRGLCTGEYKSQENNKLLTYQSSKIFRIAKDEYIQGGDIINNNGSNGESIYGKYFNNENFQRRHNCAGLLSMVNLNKVNTNNSQFIITLKPCLNFDGKFVVFGQVTKGMNVVREIGKFPCDIRGKPKLDVIIWDCGDYNVNRLSKKKNIFTETLENIEEKRKEFEITRNLGPSELLDHNIKKFESKKENILDNINNVNNGCKNKISKFFEQYSSDTDSLSSVESNRNSKNMNNKNNTNSKLSELDKLKLQLNEIKSLNNNIIKEENNKIINNKFSKSRDDKLKDYNLLKTKRNIPEDKDYCFQTINQSHKNQEQLINKKINKSFGWEAFGDDPLYRANNKRLINMPFDSEAYKNQLDVYNKLKETGNLDNYKFEIKDEKKELLVKDVEKRKENAKKFSRVRPLYDEEEVNFINNRNYKYNKKLERYFGKEVAETKANLERGTAT